MIFPPAFQDFFYYNYLTPYFGIIASE